MEQLNTKPALFDAMRGLRAEIDRVVAQAGPEQIDVPNSIGDRSLKDVIAHLTSWRLLTAARLEAALGDGEDPPRPWPAELGDEDDDVDAINRWFYEQNRDKPVEQVLRESADTFDRVERAISALPDDALFNPQRFA